MTKAVEEAGIKVPFENFILDELKLNVDKTCEISFTKRDSSGGNKEEVKGTHLPSYQTTEAFQLAINDLKAQLCRVFNIKEDKWQFVNVKGIKIGGKTDDRTYQITGSIRGTNDQKSILKTHVIHFNEGNYGMEKLVRDICSDLELYAHKYLFEKDKGNPTIADVKPPEED